MGLCHRRRTTNLLDDTEVDRCRPFGLRLFRHCVASSRYIRPQRVTISNSLVDPVLGSKNEYTSWTMRQSKAHVQPAPKDWGGTRRDVNGDVSLTGFSYIRQVPKSIWVCTEPDRAAQTSQASIGCTMGVSMGLYPACNLQNICHVNPRIEGSRMAHGIEYHSLNGRERMDKIRDVCPLVGTLVKSCKAEEKKHGVVHPVRVSKQTSC